MPSLGGPSLSTRMMSLSGRTDEGRVGSIHFVMSAAAHDSPGKLGRGKTFGLESPPLEGTEMAVEFLVNLKHPKFWAGLVLLASLSHCTPSRGADPEPRPSLELRGHDKGV